MALPLKRRGYGKQSHRGQMKNELSRRVRRDFSPCFLGHSYWQWTYFLVVSVLYGLSQASVASAQTWTNIGPGPDYVRVVRIDPVTQSTLYAGMVFEGGHYPVGGVFKSIDGGHTWSNSSRGMPTNPDIYSLAIDPKTPSTLYAGNYDGGVYKSLDGGATWTATMSPPLSNPKVYSLAIDPQTTSTVYVGMAYSGLYKSTDGGGTWNAATTGMPVTTCGLHALAIDPVTPSTVYAGEFGCGVYKSTNSGGNWSPLSTGMPDPYVHSIVIVSAATTVYAGTCNTGVYVLTQQVGIQLTISATGTGSTSTPGPYGPFITGYASGTVKAGSAPYATAVFSNTQNGVVVSEAGVPASPPTIAARFFVDSRTKVGTPSGNGTVDIRTGLAVVNGNSTAANLNLKLRDSNGSTLAGGNLQLAAGAHIAKFLDQIGRAHV